MAISEQYFPFHRLGFRSNPFQALTHEELADVAVLPNEVEALLPAEFTHLQILGAQGRGKTSTLLALQKYFVELGKRTAYEYLPPGQHSFRTNLRGLDIFLMDEFQRLSARYTVRLIKRSAKSDASGLRLVISSHEDVKSFFNDQARPLKTVQLELEDTEFLRILIQRRLTYFSLDEGSKVAFKEDALQILHHRFGDDLRTLEDFLYEFFQNLKTGGEISGIGIQTALQGFNRGVARE